MKSGVVVNRFKKGAGFVLCGGRKYHVKGNAAPPRFEVGKTVEFEIAKGAKGQDLAINVSVIEAAQENVSETASEDKREKKKKRHKSEEPVEVVDSRVKDKDLDVSKKKGETEVSEKPLDVNVFRREAKASKVEEKVKKELVAGSSGGKKRKKGQNTDEPDESEEPPKKKKTEMRELDLYEVRHEAIINTFSGMTADEALARLSDPSQSTGLVPPLMNSLLEPLIYVGRPKFKELVDSLGNLRKRITAPNMQVRGPSGRGKSYLMLAVAAYFHTFRQSFDPVYILGSEFVLLNRFAYLRRALLLTFAEDRSKQDMILACTDIDELVEFCNTQRARLILLVDEVNEFDDTKKTSPAGTADREAARKVLYQIEPAVRVLCSSDNSEFLTQKLSRGAVYVHDPFDGTELSTWLDSMEMEDVDIEKVFFHTALIPSSVDDYMHTQEKYLEDIQASFHRFVEGLNDAQQVQRVERIVRGFNIRIGTAIALEPTLFYEVTSEGVTRGFILPCFERQLQLELLSKHRELKTQAEIKELKHSIQRDSKRRRPSIIGGLAEWLTIDYILLRRDYNGSCLHYISYTKDESEAVAFHRQALGEQTEGMFLVPVFDSEHVDLIVVKVEESTKELMVTGVQITVCPWKSKSRKDSHTKWLAGVEDRWAEVLATLGPPAYKLKATFEYIISDDVRAQQSLASTSKVRCKSFKEVHEDLEFIDRLNVKTPPEKLLRCTMQLETGSQCKNTGWAPIQDKDHFLCAVHAKRK